MTSPTTQEQPESAPETAEAAASTPEQERVSDNLCSVIGSLIFAASRPVSADQLRSITGASREQLKAALDRVEVQLGEVGILLVEVGGGYQLRTRRENASWVRRLLAGKPQRLTRPMLESLAIIAYRQPVTRAEIEEVRGVDCGGTLRVLLERNLVRILGKKEEVGRPLIYGTTRFFLEFFQLKNLKSLPTLREFTELSDEHMRQLDGEVPPEEGPPAEAAAEAADTDASPIAPLEPVPATLVDDTADDEALEVLDCAVGKAEEVIKRTAPKGDTGGGQPGADAPQTVSDATSPTQSAPEQAPPSEEPQPEPRAAEATP